jgi:major membrane immunogen (membrane-anchored lipoprotein)
VTEVNYTDKLIKEQDNIENVDTVSGATRTSTALKTMVINTLKDYGENYEE